MYKVSCGNCYVGKTTTHFISSINEQLQKTKNVQQFSTPLQLASTSSKEGTWKMLKNYRKCFFFYLKHLRYSNFHNFPTICLTFKTLRIKWRLIFAIAMLFSRLRLWVGYFIYFKFTPVFLNRCSWILLNKYIGEDMKQIGY